MMKEETKPLVSCIMPTYNRRAFVPYAIQYFLRQDYPHKELIIIDDGSDCIEDLLPQNPAIRYYRLDKKISLGAKLNAGCGYARGNIIAHWDDDDWYAANRLTYQVETLLKKHIFIVGINRLLYFDLYKKQAFNYIYPPKERVWLSGSSLCYKKSFWAENQFADINVGMDALFVWRTSQDHLCVLPDSTFAVHMIHNGNGSPKDTSSAWWHKYPVASIEQLMQEDYHTYSNGHFYQPEGESAPQSLHVSRSSFSIKKQSVTSIGKNVFVCLVHENKECILDIIRNLKYYDPSSLILLYNGSDNPQLLDKELFSENDNVFLYPRPQPATHGYLHTFALDCMQYALDNFTFSTFTIVDSDQLLIRYNYSDYIHDFFSRNPSVGLLSSNPHRISTPNEHFYVASEALKEFELWKPLLESFPDGLNKFVYWTFWPSTVLSAKAIQELVKLFKENILLKKIMQETKIWATEEVIFPTLISLLGYEIALNPCDYSYVKYKVSQTVKDIESALDDPAAFWVHPVERVWENPLRKFIRQQSNDYLKENVDARSAVNEDVFGFQSILQKVNKIEGWLSEKEADLLMVTTLKACIEFSDSHRIVEIGSYQGKSTIIFGSILKMFFPERKICAIDTHDGRLGDKDRGLLLFPPSFKHFKKNVEEAGISDFVEIILDYTTNVVWQQPIALLFIDGLHDYSSVSGDFYHFSPWLSPGSYIAFHDYADYYPGVKHFVNELLETGHYRKIGLADSMMVIQKHNFPKD